MDVGVASPFGFDFLERREMKPGGNHFGKRRNLVKTSSAGTS